MDRFILDDAKKTKRGIDKIIIDGEKFDLNENDIRRIADNKVIIIAYESLFNVNSLDELFTPFGAFILLYQTAEFFGHWVCLLKTGERDLEFYDPYGLNVDEELNINNAFHLRMHRGVITPHLTTLINIDGWRVRYNKERLQKVLRDVNTCGRYCALRVRFKMLSMKKFNRLLKDNKAYNPDFWVTALTLLC